LRDAKIKFSETEKMEEALKHAEIIYMTRIQQERFAERSEYEQQPWPRRPSRLPAGRTRVLVP